MNAPGCKTTQSSGYVSCENSIINGNIYSVKQLMNTECTI
jgi:hypothetical protein